MSTPSGPGALACFSAQPGSERPGGSPFTEPVPTHTRPDVILLVEGIVKLSRIGLLDPQHARFKAGPEPIILGVSQPSFR